MRHFNKMTVTGAAHIEYVDENGFNNLASLPLKLIRMAWFAGCEFEDLADGFGKGLGTMGGDWSGIRDSSEAAHSAMLERALNFIQNEINK